MRAHSAFAFEQRQRGFERVDVVAQLVDAVQEFLGLGAARHVAAFFLQSTRRRSAAKVSAARRAKPNADARVADLMSRDVADDARQLFFEIGCAPSAAH
jgi:hypothetical protein